MDLQMLQVRPDIRTTARGVWHKKKKEQGSQEQVMQALLRKQQQMKTMFLSVLQKVISKVVFIEHDIFYWVK